MSEPYIWPDNPQKILELLKRQPGVEIRYEDGEQFIYIDQAVFETRVEAAWGKACDVLNRHGRSADDLKEAMPLLHSKLTEHEYTELVDTLNIFALKPPPGEFPLSRRKKPGPN